MGKLLWCVTLCLLLSLSGCGAKQKIHPPLSSTTNSFDENAYQAILAASGLIDRTEAELGTSETYTTPVAKRVSEALAYLIDSYHDSQHAYMTYHKAMLVNDPEAQARMDALAKRLYDLSVKTKALNEAKTP
jgi:hypothetical protein